jgi:hypothetical protein
MAARMSPGGAQAVVRVFYRDYASGTSISSTKPESLLSDRLAPLAERLWASPDNFLGVVDRHDVILQSYVDDEPGMIVFELVYPEQTGALQLTVTRDEALRRLQDLPERFDDSLLPGARHVD